MALHIFVDLQKEMVVNAYICETGEAKRFMQHANKQGYQPYDIKVDRLNVENPIQIGKSPGVVIE
jgi:hypothetical protein